MHNLEKRIALLEAKVTQDSDAIRIAFPADDETDEDARAREGIAHDWRGQIIFVRFVSCGASKSEPTSTTNESPT